MNDPPTDQSSKASSETPAPADEAALLLTFLNDRNVACPLCGYNLRNLTKPRCPECGRDIVLSVGMAEPYLRGWIMTLIPTLVTAGIGVVVVRYLISDFREGHLTASEFFATSQAIAYSYCIFNIMLGAALVIFRRNFMRLPRLLQRLLASLAFLTDFAAFLVIVNRG